MPELLIRKRQLAMKIEGSKGNFEVDLRTEGTAKDYADFTLVTPQMGPQALQFPRNIVHPSLTPIEMFKPGSLMFTLQHGVELAGHNSNVGAANAVEPPIGRLLAACGFISEAVTGYDIVSWTTGTEFEHGETITGQTSGATATVVGTARQGDDTRLYYIDLAGGPFDITGESVVGSTSGTEAVMSATGALANDDWAFHLNSIMGSTGAAAPTLSGMYYVDGRQWELEGIRGNVEFVFNHGDRGVANFTWTGIVNTTQDGPLLEGANKPTLNHPIPDPFLGVGLTIDNGGWTPIFAGLTINLGNEVILRENSQDSDGWRFGVVTSRAPTLTMQPDEELQAVMNVPGDYRDGRVMSGRFTYGKLAAAAEPGGRFEFRMPAMQFIELTESDRDEVVTWDAVFGLYGGTGPSGGLGNNNELTIINDCQTT